MIDQLEQWLHAHGHEHDSQLAQALRQCDGEHVQCVVLVRDDFWMALSRFMGEVQIELVQGQNMAAVDLFDPIHARKVLAAFGQAFGRLSDTESKEQGLFLDEAVRGLATDGRVISVRLALFAEMVKGKPWTEGALREVGGTAGIGVNFLEETFSAVTASGEHRFHQKAVRAVLKTLLPESGSDIKGHMRSYAELLEASGYAGRPKDFADLIRILDSETRLITPTDPELTPRREDAGTQGSSGENNESNTPLLSASLRPGVFALNEPAKYYQLTHDYLVPALRQWLTRKQRETRSGRAELRLAERPRSGATSRRIAFSRRSGSISPSECLPIASTGPRRSGA